MDAAFNSAQKLLIILPVKAVDKSTVIPRNRHVRLCFTDSCNLGCLLIPISAFTPIPVEFINQWYWHHQDPHLRLCYRFLQTVPYRHVIGPAAAELLLRPHRLYSLSTSIGVVVNEWQSF